jgi:hypothetical protein
MSNEHKLNGTAGVVLRVVAAPEVISLGPSKTTLQFTGLHEFLVCFSEQANVRTDTARFDKQRHGSILVRRYQHRPSLGQPGSRESCEVNNLTVVWIFRFFPFRRNGGRPPRPCKLLKRVHVCSVTMVCDDSRDDCGAVA